jgi:hypothetical protein
VAAKGLAAERLSTLQSMLTAEGVLTSKDACMTAMNINVTAKAADVASKPTSPVSRRKCGWCERQAQRDRSRRHDIF